MSRDNEDMAGSGKLKQAASSLGLVSAAVVVATAVAGAAAVTAFRKRRSDGGDEAIFHLRQLDGEWALEAEGSDPPRATFPTKSEGLAAARELAQQSAPCELVIYKTDGSEQDRHSYTS